MIIKRCLVHIALIIMFMSRPRSCYSTPSNAVLMTVVQRPVSVKMFDTESKYMTEHTKNQLHSESIEYIEQLYGWEVKAG